MKMKSLLGTISIFVTTQIFAAPLPHYSSEKHEGVATCSSGVCHGKVAEDTSSNVKLNEYRTWLSDDYHSYAYKRLFEDESKQMAVRLGLKSAHTAKICLDCHTDNVPKEKRGRRFQISDGVGCEACHGGSEKWIKDHTEDDVTHARNISQGMYPSEKPRDRAKLCLSCHLGTKDKFATHKIMAAGHPRLSFELETFTVNQVAHYKVDADYEQRKGSIKSYNMWLTGLLYKADNQMALLQSSRFKQHGLFPELAFYECHSCHRPMEISRWPTEKSSRNVTSGTVRLEDAALVVLTSVLESQQNSKAEQLKSAIKKLHKSSESSKESIINASQEIQTIIKSIANPIIDKTYTNNDKIAMRKKLVNDSIGGVFRDFSSAEQVFLAIDTIIIDLKQEAKYTKVMDKWYETIIDEDKFNPNQFAVFAKLLLKLL